MHSLSLTGAELLLQIRAYTKMGIPALLHRGNPEEGTSIYADARPGQLKFSNLAIR